MSSLILPSRSYQELYQVLRIKSSFLFSAILLDPSASAGPAGAPPSVAPRYPPSAAMSPYGMNPGYQRPAPVVTDSSDHGYSTMTPTVQGTSSANGAGNTTASEGTDVLCIALP